MKRKVLFFVTLLLVLVASGCRPDDVIDDPDINPDSIEFLTNDTLNVGVWVDDTVATYADQLLEHQRALNDVFFDYNSEELSAEMLEALMADANYILNNSGFRVLLEGHCDQRGTIDYNLALGERRAQAVLDYLSNYGIPAVRLETVSYGKERPFITGDDDWAHSQNRRVHLRVLPE